jgi:uncharacterized protein (DUF305 family)
LKTHLTKAWLLALVLASALTLTACGSAGGGQQGDESTGDEQGKTEKTDGMMSGTDHDQRSHDSMGTSSGSMARQIVMENGTYSDKAFIDAMVPHHQSAIEMAQVATR